MKKLFLTSGLAICMASSAFAVAHDINNDANHTLVGTGDSTATPPIPASTASCQEPTLGTWTNDTTFYAKWNPNNYDVIYHAGTAKNRAGTISHTPGYASGGTATFTQSATYDANYVTLYNNNQCDFMPNNANCNANSPYYSQSGYNFTGWAADYNISGNTASPLNADFTTGGTSYGQGDSILYKLTHGVNIYAQWAPKTYTVRYSNGNCGTFSSTTGLGDIKDYETGEIYHIDGIRQYYYTVPSNANNALEFESVYTPLTPAQVGFNIKTGYHFAGWKTDVPSTVTEMHNPSIVVSTYGTTLAAGTPMASPWSIALDEYQYGPDLKLEGLCAANTYNVVYHAGTAKNSSTNTTHTPSYPSGGTATVTKIATYDQDYTILKNTVAALGSDSSATTTPYFSQTGYQFAGWRSDYDIANNAVSLPGLNADYTAGGTFYNPDEHPLYQVTNENGINLYAQWTPMTWRVQYYGGAHGTVTSNNGTNYYMHWADQADSLTYDSIYTPLTTSTVGLTTNAGYTFAGWSRNQNDTAGSNTILAAGQPMASKWTEVLDGALQLYAIYSANQYTLTYDCGKYVDNVHSINKSAEYADALASTHAFTYTFASAGTSALTPSDVCKLAGYHVNGSWNCVVTGTSTAVNYADVTTANWSVPNNVTCSLTWDANTIGLEWRPGDNATAQNGGTYNAGENTSSCKYDLGINVGVAPKKPGYIFQGWTTNPNAEGVIDSGN